MKFLRIIVFCCTFLMCDFVSVSVWTYFSASVASGKVVRTYIRHDIKQYYGESFKKNTKLIIREYKLPYCELTLKTMEPKAPQYPH